jgi:malate synthase
MDTVRTTTRSPHGSAGILSDDALAFLGELHNTFDSRRLELLNTRSDRDRAFGNGHRYEFLPDTAHVRTTQWSVAPPPHDLVDRRCEITGPTDRKMVINALNSGAKVFMADFEDSNSPTWSNVIEGQQNLYDAIRRNVDFTAPNGKRYELVPDPATLMVRPRGLHLPEVHIEAEGLPMSGSLVDFGLYFFHNAAELLKRGSGPYFYLPKLESHLEARWWNDVFVHAQRSLGIPVGSIKATVLIEALPAAFEMEEILYELRSHSAGLNAGRWDYIFSIIKKYRSVEGFVLPDRSQIGMTVPFMRSYTDLLVKTCHRRGAHAMGGMAAFIPSRRDETINRVAIDKVTQDKRREARDGCDGTWVAHPDLVPVATSVFDDVLVDRPNQIDKGRDDVEVNADDLSTFAVDGGTITEEGVRLNIDVAIRYIASWLTGTGAAAIYNLMEDAATAEISRSQVWQWVTSEATTDTGVKITPALVRKIAADEADKIRSEIGHEAYEVGRFEDARELFEMVSLDTDFPDFLTLPAYEILER